MFAVIWRHTALDALADAIVQADLATRDAIEQAVTRLNLRLLNDPNNLSTPQTGQGRRIAFDQPCGIRFTVDDAAGIVRVTLFWTY
jgi:hypothetical protein